MPASITSISVYPVKSTMGHALERARVLAAGLEHDRRWMLVDGQGAFITGRDRPSLLLVRATPGDGGLTLEAPGTEPFTVRDATGDGDLAPAIIWRDEVTAQRVDPGADAWFSRYLGIGCTLVVMPDDTYRAVDPEHGAPGDRVSFADGYPLLLIGDASLADLNRRAPARAEMARFRPNLTVGGADAFAEDGWRRIRIAGVDFEIPKPCDRCVMTTVNPATGIKDPDLEPLRTLSAYRRDRERGILFGVNLIPRGTGVVRVGDAVEILA